MKKIGIIGSGFSSLSAACYLKQAGFDVSVFEKNTTFGGRARQLKKDGFTFDMGPTWYWMPDVFERFFSDFNKKPSDFYHLQKLSPGYKVFFGKDDSITISDRLEKILEAFEQEEKGSAKKIKPIFEAS
jgi:phytoene desaturase